MSKMLVDGGASVNLIPYTTFYKLGKGPGDLMERILEVMRPRPGGQ